MYLISKSSYSIIPHMRHCLSVRCGHVACIDTGRSHFLLLAVSLVPLTSRLGEDILFFSLSLSFMSRQLCFCPHHHIILCRLSFVSSCLYLKRKGEGVGCCLLFRWLVALSVFGYSVSIMHGKEIGEGSLSLRSLSLSPPKSFSFLSPMNIPKRGKEDVSLSRKAKQKKRKEDKSVCKAHIAAAMQAKSMDR